MRIIDLNCDLGEGFGQYSLGRDQEIMKYISSANIACGFHAGDPSTMNKTVKLALENKRQHRGTSGFAGPSRFWQAFHGYHAHGSI